MYLCSNLSQSLILCCFLNFFCFFTFTECCVYHREYSTDEEHQLNQRRRAKCECGKRAYRQLSLVDKETFSTATKPLTSGRAPTSTSHTHNFAFHSCIFFFCSSDTESVRYARMYPFLFRGWYTYWGCSERLFYDLQRSWRWRKKISLCLPAKSRERKARSKICYFILMSALYIQFWKCSAPRDDFARHGNLTEHSSVSNELPKESKPFPRVFQRPNVENTSSQSPWPEFTNFSIQTVTPSNIKLFKAMREIFYSEIYVR